MFGATGKYIGRIDLGSATSTQDMAASLKRAGYASGMYIVRSVTNRAQIQRVQVR